jgi:phytanoyl-CoA hydroxylase
MRLTDEQIALYRRAGHLTVPGVLPDAQVTQAIAELEAWGRDVLATLPEEKKKWYLEQNIPGVPVLRKLDNPVHERPFFRTLAGQQPLLTMVEQLIGPGVAVYFSQVFLKPPGGGPKPVHQDNFYFGPNYRDGVVTAWLALDEATVENGCLYFGDGTNHGPIHPHIAPPGEPFNLQVPSEIAKKAVMTPAPVPRGGVSFHHGNTFHQSSDNRSTRWRRAAAFHYVNHDTRFVTPALPYDESIVVKIS